jgi:hypothetical protein
MTRRCSNHKGAVRGAPAIDLAAAARRHGGDLAKIGTSPWFRSISIDHALALVRESIYPVGEFQQAILCVHHTRRRCDVAISFGG